MTFSKSLTLLVLGLFTVALIACGDDGDAEIDAAPAAPVFGTQEDIDRATTLFTTDMSGYDTWNLFPGTDNPAISEMPHGMGFASIFVNPMFETNAAAPPNGSVVVKNNLNSDDITDIDSITAMLKIDGFDADTGDWFYAKFNRDGTLAENGDGVALAGRVGKGGAMGCVPCHTGAAGNDFLYSNDM